MEITHRAWNQSSPPRKVLFIRLQALGDVVITLPYIRDFAKEHPTTKIDFLTLEENKTIPESLLFFNRVFSIGSGRNNKLQYASALSHLPRLIAQQYDVVFDLQNNRLSNIIRKIIRPKAWVEFDRYSPRSAGERNRQTIERAGLGSVSVNSKLETRIPKKTTDELLKSAGWNGFSKIVILNPAGFFESRNWPIENYFVFMGLWKNHHPNTQFLLVGTERILDKANALKEKASDSVIQLINKTNPAEAFALVNRSSFLLTEDSGLMHMAWVQGVPTLALFGSSRSDWSAPQGIWSLCLHSGDLPCGACMLANCKFGDNRCLTHYTPEFVFEKSQQLISIQP
jgi:heptosyltransferase II